MLYTNTYYPYIGNSPRNETQPLESLRSIIEYPEISRQGITILSHAVSLLVGTRQKETVAILHPLSSNIYMYIYYISLAGREIMDDQKTGISTISKSNCTIIYNK